MRSQARLSEGHRDLALAALPFAVEKGARAHDQSQAIRHLIAQYK